VRRNSALAAALTAGLAFGCRKAPEKTAPAAPAVSASLTAPDPSGTIVGSRLSKSSSSYTNEMQAEYLQNQAEQLGIQRIGAGNSSAAESQTAPLTYAEGMERTKALEEALANQRRQIDRNKPKTVDLPGNTPQLLQNPGDGGAPAPGTAP